MKWVEVFWKLMTILLVVFVFSDIILLVLFGVEYMLSELYGIAESMCLRIINLIPEPIQVVIFLFQLIVVVCCLWRHIERKMTGK